MVTTTKAPRSVDCLRRLLEDKNDSVQRALIKFIAEFVNCDYQAVRSWLVRDVMPIGENLLRLLFFLELAGRSPQALSELQPGLYDIAKLVAFRVIDLTRAMELLCLQDRSSVLKALGNRRGVSKKKLTQAVEDSRQYEDRLSAESLHWQAKLVSLVPGRPGVRATHQESKHAFGHSEVIEVLSQQIKAAIPLARLMVGDEFSPEERERLRKLTVTTARWHGVFELSNLLNRLCGEEARQTC